MGQGNSFPSLKPEDKGVLACQLYKLCKIYGLKPHIRDCRVFVEKIWDVSPWLEHCGLCPAKWDIVGQQMVAYERVNPGVLTEEDFTFFQVVAALLCSDPRPPWRSNGETQSGQSLQGTTEEEEESNEDDPNPKPLYPWGMLRECAGRDSRAPRGRTKGKVEKDFEERVQEGVKPPIVNKYRKGKSDEGTPKREWKAPETKGKSDEEGTPKREWKAPETKGKSDEEGTPKREGWGTRRKKFQRNLGTPSPPEVGLNALSFSPAATSLSQSSQGTRSFTYGRSGPSEPLSILTQSLSAALVELQEIDLEEWEGAGAYAVIVERDPMGNENRFHRPVPFKLLKELKEAVSKYGPLSPYVKHLLANTTATWPWAPADWKEVSGAILTPGQLVAYGAAVRQEALRYVKETNIAGTEDAVNMITGAGPYSQLIDQLQFDPRVMAAVQYCHIRGFAKIDAPGTMRDKLVGLKQRASESPTDFVSRVQLAVRRSLGSGPGMDSLIAQLVRDGLRAWDLSPPSKR
ncbi:uncharacterized protein [Notamacropus eugenii]|uniref:uncharacterized protein n=1 Tax=Notamacropus eugenii TaxID=9315 RepID=UPI003B6765A9